MDSRQLIRSLDEKTHAALGPHVTDAPFAMIDFPDIRNVGDSAIWQGEMAYFRTHFGRAPAYISTMHDLSIDALRRAVPDGVVFIHGGGNFGDIWIGHQNFREQVLDALPGHRIVQMPQSIHYNDIARADETARAIARHGNFVLLVRDEESLHFGRKHFDCMVKLCPDMAPCIGSLTPHGRIDRPVLAMLRQDREQVSGRDMSAHPDIPVEDWIGESKAAIRAAKLLGIASTLPSIDPQHWRQGKLNAAATARFARGVAQLSRARAIVTDRLHVHIISLLLGKPHAVLDNSYGKIGRFMDAFSGGSELSYRATSLDDAVAWARQQAADAA